MNDMEPKNIGVWINGAFVGTYGSMKVFSETREKPRRDTDKTIEYERTGTVVVEFFDGVANEGTPEAGRD